MAKYDYLIVGAGLFGAVFAYEAGKRGKSCLVIDKRPHIAGNIYTEQDHVLLIDDFLANGCALLGLIDIVKKSGATLEGAGIVIEKGFQSGGQQIRDMGVRLESLAIIESMSDTSLTFRE